MSALLMVFLGALCAVTAAPTDSVFSLYNNAPSVAAPLSDDSKATIISYKNTNDGSGNYHYRFKTSNGLKKSEMGFLVNAGQPDEHIEVLGEFSYIDENGAVHLVQYTAGQNGYRVEQRNKVKPTKPRKPVQVAGLLPDLYVVATLVG